MSIRNLKDGSKKPWLCECYPQGRGGKRVRKKFATKGEAKSFELFTMREVNDKPWLGKKADHRRLQDLLDTWWQVHGHTVKTGEKTYVVLAKTVQMLGNPIASLFTANDYLKYRANRVSHHPTRPDLVISATTHNIELKTFRAMFNKLTKYGYWEQPNPVANIELVKDSERELAFLTKEQIAPFLERVCNDNSPSAKQIYVACKICLATGARIGEALGLKRSQVSRNKLLFTETKGKKNRSVPISTSLYNELLNVAVSEHALFDVRYYAAWECVKRALPAHVPSGQATHVLRHTFASHFMMNGGDILVLQRILGHSKIEQTIVYAHFSPDHLMQYQNIPSIHQKVDIKVELKRLKGTGGYVIDDLKSDAEYEISNEVDRERFVRECDRVKGALSEIEQVETPEEADEKVGHFMRVHDFLNNALDNVGPIGESVAALGSSISKVRDLAKTYNKVASFFGLPVIPELLLS